MNTSEFLMGRQSTQEMAKIDTAGAVVINWNEVEGVAKTWKPCSGNPMPGIAKLLLAARDAGAATQPAAAPNSAEPVAFAWRPKDKPWKSWEVCFDLKQAEDSEVLLKTEIRFLSWHTPPAAAPAPAVPQGALQVIDAKIASVKAANIGRGGKVNSAVSFALGLLEDVREVIAAHEAKAAPAVPSGWKLVPVEPTPEMVRAAQDCPEGRGLRWFHVHKAKWSAMLAAAPAAPAQEPAQYVPDGLGLPPEYETAIQEIAQRYDMSVRAVLKAAIRLYQAECNGSVKVTILADRLQIADDSSVDSGQPKGRPCDNPPGCNGSNCLGCGEPSQEPVNEAVEAIKFAIKEGIGASVFLNEWLHGDTSEWPEFDAHIAALREKEGRA